jgi:hypothetical protein
MLDTIRIMAMLGVAFPRRKAKRLRVLTKTTKIAATARSLRNAASQKAELQSKLVSLRSAGRSCALSLSVSLGKSRTARTPTCVIPILEV